MKGYTAILIGIMLIGCNSNNSDETLSLEDDKKMDEPISFTMEQIQTAEIEIGYLIKDTIHTHIASHGTIILNPDGKATISFPIEGIIDKIYVQTGNWVSKGAKLVSLKHPTIIDLQTDFLKLQSEFEYQEQEYSRQLELFNQDAISEKVFQKAQSDYKILEAKLLGLNEKLKMIGIDPLKLTNNNIKNSIIITAPIDGYVANLGVELGKLTTPYDPLLRIINNKNVFLSLEVFAQHKHLLDIGLTLEFFPSGHPDDMFLATITSIGQSVDPDEKTIDVIAKPTTHNEMFTEGSFIEALINVKVEASMVLPKEAVVSKAGKSFVFLSLSPTTFKKVEVKALETYGEYIAIDTGAISVSDKIVIKGANYLYIND